MQLKNSLFCVLLFLGFTISVTGQVKEAGISIKDTLAANATASTFVNIMYLFTPNNDGVNDLWELPDLSNWGTSDVKVYNRWGVLVFADNNYNNTWDGTSGGTAVPAGAYFFIIKTQNAGVKKGTVNIVR